MKTKITLKEACDKTAAWLERNGENPLKMPYWKFDDAVREFCSKYGYEIN